MENSIASAMQAHLDNLTKPAGSLGKLEGYAMKLAAIQGRVPPVIAKKAVYVFAGDHGIVEEGVSLYPKDVTHEMMANFLSGGAAINVLSRYCGFEVFAVDGGVDADFPAGSKIIDLKVGRGTKSFLTDEAMTHAEFDLAMENGRKLAAGAIKEGFDLVAVGDMGIGNTTTAAALLVATGFPAGAVVDRGTGIDDAALAHKYDVVVEGVKKHGPYSGAPDIMRKLGGFEMAEMTGFILGLKGSGVACMIDGFPVTAAAYMAFMIDPEVASYLFAGHLGKVKGHGPILERMGLEPIVAFDMRLGEGTGAVIGGFMVDLASKTACEMASFESAGVSKSGDVEKNF
jgi:nicotinate-nucleotide--dimethylbenzimidazole phosphoribosyltransferase